VTLSTRSSFQGGQHFKGQSSPYFPNQPGYLLINVRYVGKTGTQGESTSLSWEGEIKGTELNLGKR